MKAKLRIRCPHCNEATNVVNNACTECNKPVDIANEGKVYLYRQGSPYGIAGGFGIYVNGQPYGHIGNKELLCFPLSYGEYNFHCAVGMSRKCQDMQVKLTPENNTAYLKVYIKPGFWANSFVIETIQPEKLELEE